MKSVAEAGSRTPRATPPPEGMSPEAAIKQWRANMPPKSAAKPGMNPMETSAWQQSLFNEKPTPDVGAKVRQGKPAVPRTGDPEAQRLRETAKPARDTDIIGKVRLEHPDWSLSKQLMEAAKRAQETGQ
jgi:hypothetical protein